MPSHKSNWKRMRTNERDRLQNRAFRSNLRAALKSLREETGKDEAATKLRAASSLLDRAAAKGIVHKRNAARNKSRLTAMVQKLGQ